MPRIGRRFRPNLRQSLRFQLESGDWPVPILFLKFGENAGTEAKDSSPEGNDGEIVGASWVKGWLGPGLTFDRIDDYVKVDDFSPDLTGPVSISLRFKVTALGHDVHLISKGSGTTKRCFAVKVTSTGLVTGAVSSNGSTWKWAGEEQISALTWYHLVVVYDTVNSRQLFYVDASLEINSVGVSSIHSETGEPLEIGAWDEGYLMHGIIDEVRIYGVALSANQVRELFLGIE